MKKKFLKITIGCMAILMAVAVSLLLLQPRISIGVLAGPVSFLLSSLTGKEQVVSGRYYLVPGMWTTIAVEDGLLLLTGDEDLRIDARINSARTTVHLWSLITGEINLDGIIVEGMTLDILAGKEKKHSGSDGKMFGEFEDETWVFPLKQTGAIELSDISATVRQRSSQSLIHLTLVKGRGLLHSGTSGHLEIDGVLNGREFTAELKTGPMHDLGKRDVIWPLAVHLVHKSIAAELNGSIEGTAAGLRLKTKFSLSGKHFDDLSSIIGMHGSKEQPFSIQGSAELSAGYGYFDLSEVQLGTVNLLLTVSAKELNTENPRFVVALQSDCLDIDRLKGFMGVKGPGRVKPQSHEEKTKISRNDILLPEIFPRQHFDLDIDLKEIIIAGKKIWDVRLISTMENGVVKDSPFTARFRNASLAGHYSLDLAGKEPKVSVHLDSSFVNIGAILEEQSLADDIVFQLDRVKMDFDTSGRTLNELVNNLVFSIYAEDGRFEYKELNTGAILPVSLINAKITGVPGDKISMDAQGEINDIPITLSMKIDDRRGESSAPGNYFSFSQNVEIAGARMELMGEIALPYTGTGISLSCKLDGERLDSLSQLLNLQLPRIGPYSIHGLLGLTSEGYRLNDFELQIGSSTLSGNVLIDTKVVPPAVVIDMQARTIQLDDYKEIWLGTRDADDEENEDREPGKTDTSKQEKHFLTDQTVLDSYDVTLSVTVKEVYSGDDYLGNGLLNIEQRRGSLKVSPLHLQLPKGIVDVEFFIEPIGNDRRYLLDVTIDDLEYSFVGRWFKSDSEMSGSLTLHAFLDSQSPDFRSIMANGSGSINFLLKPEQLPAGVIDMWAVNLLSYVISFDGVKDGSKVNCVAGRFTLTDGLLSRDELLVDTSRIQISGNLVVDFHRNWIEGRFSPRPKRPQFFSLATPIQISGPLSALNVGMVPGGGIGTLIRLIVDYIIVPLKWIVLGTLPEDGTADCLQIMEPEK